MTRMQYTISIAFSPLDQLTEIARAAEELGFDNIALPDSIFYFEKQSVDYPYTADGKRMFDENSPWVDPLILASNERSPGRVLPIASLDSGLVFERNLTFAGRSMVNTLEPRMYYLYVPYRDQSRIPLFDTGLADFNYAQIFSENVYSGADRISDANQVTLALTSRLIDPGSGQEVLRGLIGQRYYFSSQRVALASTIPPRTDKSSSLLVGMAGRVAPRVTMEATAQLAAADQSPERLNVGVRYQPEIGKIVNLGYRYTNAALNPNPIPGALPVEVRQVDVSGQWPIGRGWYLVGRYNYSLQSHKVIESLMGFEYNAGCWVVRTVVQRFVTATGTQANIFFVQLELDGFSRIGSNPLEVLRRNIPGYSVLNQPGMNTPGFDFHSD